MNKYQEAINYLYNDYFFRNQEGSFLIRSYLDEMKELVDKATPKKIVILPKLKEYGYRCPSCGANVDYNYCINCGQAIDWSNDE